MAKAKRQKTRDKMNPNKTKKATPKWQMKESQDGQKVENESLRLAVCRAVTRPFTSFFFNTEKAPSHEGKIHT